MFCLTFYGILQACLFVVFILLQKKATAPHGAAALNYYDANKVCV